MNKKKGQRAAEWSQSGARRTRGTTSTGTLTLLALFWATPAVAITCSPLNILLENQSQVNSFQAEHGPCDRIGGVLEIRDDLVVGDDITDLTPLAALTSAATINVRGNASLASLAGLGGLTVVDNLTVRDNAAMANLNGLSNLESVTFTLRIRDMPGLNSLQGAPLLQSVGTFYVWSTGLNDLSGWPSGLLDVELLGILSNPSLTSLNGLPAGLVTVTDLEIDNNDALPALTGLPAFAGLETITLQNNEVLADLAGLAASTIAFDPMFPPDLVVEANSALADLQGLPAVQRLGDVIVRQNPNMTALTGLDSLVEVWGELALRDNPKLVDCSTLQVVLDDVDDGDPGPGILSEIPPGPDDPPDTFGLAYIDIGNNAGGCSSLAEVLGADSEQIHSSGFEAGEGG